MTWPLYTIGRFCSRHHHITVAVWLEGEEHLAQPTAALAAKRD